MITKPTTEALGIVESARLHFEAPDARRPSENTGAEEIHTRPSFFVDTIVQLAKSLLSTFTVAFNLFRSASIPLKAAIRRG